MAYTLICKMANNNLTYVQTTKDTVPAKTALAAQTIETVGTKVIGTDTAFSQLNEGDYILDLANDEMRIIDTVVSSTEAYLKSAFTSNLAAGTALEMIFKKDFVKEINIENVDAGTATVDGQNLAAGKKISFSKIANRLSSKRGFIDPVILDATSSDCLVTTLK